jgi:recombinational DNA repair protein RecR
MDIVESLPLFHRSGYLTKGRLYQARSSLQVCKGTVTLRVNYECNVCIASTRTNVLLVLFERSIQMRGLYINKEIRVMIEE